MTGKIPNLSGILEAEAGELLRISELSGLCNETTYRAEKISQDQYVKEIS